ncbi:MAG: hypothetical protein JNL51_11925 [Chitinophagaceae bacterium]|nr:hypothetical protein [Chitinophagaceae bacterium]
MSNPKTLSKNKPISIHARKIYRLLLRIAVSLIIINLASLWIEKAVAPKSFISNALIYFFDVSLENNIPALFSTLILLTSGVLLFFIYRISVRQQDKRKGYWLLLSLVFVFLSIDESTGVHEQFNKLRNVIGDDPSGLLHYTWILPYSIFALAAGIFFMKFLFSLPVKTRNLFILSGGMYVFAALAFELPEGYITTKYGAGHTYDKLFCTFEEFMEMYAIILFIYALLQYIAGFNASIRFIAEEDKDAPEAVVSASREAAQ